MKKFNNSTMFFCIVSISLFAPMFSITTPYMVSLTLLSIIITILIYFLDFRLFVPTLFFSITSLLNPLIFYWIRKYEIYIPQVNFLIPMIIYLPIILKNKAFRNKITWLKCGTFDKLTWILLVTMIVFGSISLVTWSYFLQKDLSTYLDFIPDISIGLLILYGLAFPVFNSIFEEFLARAFLYDGFQTLFDSIYSVIISQAFIFALWHYRGFPGGIIGVMMVFIWSIFLGIIRFRSKGMVAPLIAHFFADLSIVIILFFSKALIV